MSAPAGDDGAADPGPMGPHVGKMPFTQARGLVVEHMTNSYSRIVMPRKEQNGDGSYLPRDDSSQHAIVAHTLEALVALVRLT